MVDPNLSDVESLHKILIYLPRVVPATGYSSNVVSLKVASSVKQMIEQHHFKTGPKTFAERDIVHIDQFGHRDMNAIYFSVRA